MNAEAGWARRSFVLLLASVAAVTAPADAAAQLKPAPIVAATSATATDRLTALLSQAQAPRTPERYTKRGLIIGAIAGAAGGLGFGGFTALLCQAESDDCLWVIPATTLIGAAGGAAIGALIGAAIKREPETRMPIDTISAVADRRARTDTVRPDEREAHRASALLRTGSFSLALGRADATIHTPAADPFVGDGTAVRVAAYAELRPWLALGGELGQAWLGNAGNVRNAGLAARATWAMALFSPYLSANLGLYQTTGPSLEFFGGALGAGARVTPVAGGRFFVDLEARASRNLHNIEPMRMTTISVGSGLYW